MIPISATHPRSHGAHRYGAVSTYDAVGRDDQERRSTRTRTSRTTRKRQWKRTRPARRTERRAAKQAGRRRIARTVRSAVGRGVGNGADFVAGLDRVGGKGVISELGTRSADQRTEVALEASGGARILRERIERNRNGFLLSRSWLLLGFLVRRRCRRFRDRLGCLILRTYGMFRGRRMRNRFVAGFGFLFWGTFNRFE